jgi:hypothetical protein
LCYREDDGYRVAAVFSTTAQRLARAEFSIIHSNGHFASARKGIFYVESWAASSQTGPLHFSYCHKRDAASLALAGHPPTRSDFFRKIVVSPSRNGGAERDARIEDLCRIFEAFERGEDPAPADPKAAWLPPPTRQY